MGSLGFQFLVGCADAVSFSFFGQMMEFRDMNDYYYEKKRGIFN